MNFSKVFCPVIALAVMSGVSGLAQAAQVSVSQSPAQSHVADAAPESVSASCLAMSQRTSHVLTTPAQQEPKKLPLADFGQWDESASEN